MKGKKKTPDKWAKLVRLISQYAAAEVADSWSGGGDPEEIPLRKLELKLTRERLNYHIRDMKREYDGE